MKFVSNAGTDRVLDLIRPGLKHGHKLDMVSEAFSVFAFAELLNELPLLDQARIVIQPAAKALPAKSPRPDQLGLLGTALISFSAGRLVVTGLASELVDRHAASLISFCVTCIWSLSLSSY